MKSLRETDPAIADAIAGEYRRQTDQIELIASENYVSSAVLEAMGSVLTNKYAEGYPGRRYYGGCEWVDVAENLAIDRAQQLFAAEHANVQPHSGNQANMAAMFALLKPGDKFMGMNLAHGGHLSHGSRVSFSGKLYQVVAYGIDRETETIDYEELRAVALRERPRLIVAGASAYPRTIDFARMRAIADEAGAYLMADIAHPAGLVATGLHPSPIPYAHITTTTTHKTLRGPRGGAIFCAADLASAVDKAVFPGVQGGPLMHVIAAKAVAFGEALQPAFAAYQEQVLANARRLVARLQDGGLRAVSGGTDTHLMLIDLTPLQITGRQAEKALDEAGITLNKNAIPFDPLPPAEASGIRIGTPAVTTRGFGLVEMDAIAEMIVEVLHHMDDERVRGQVRERARALCRQFPLPSAATR